MDSVELKIGAMSCEKCAARLQRVLDGAVGVKRARVSFGESRASVSYRAQTIGATEIIALVENAGFTVGMG